MTEVREIAGVPFRTCRSDQEEEATTLGGTLLLPRPLLLRAVKHGMGIAEIAKKYGVTVEMARFPFNTIGVAKQLRRAAAQVP
jgi:Zn-dependent peptidase ImmA (M78 family)